MGSTPPFTRELDDLLPPPPIHNLCSHFILGEIIDHIDIIAHKFPGVKIHLLKEHLWGIRNKNNYFLNPEVNLRGFLKVFGDTQVFKNAREELDDSMKVQLDTFIAGGDEAVVMAAGGKGNEFHLPPSPPVKHHFGEFSKKYEEKFESLAQEVEQIFQHEHAHIGTNGLTINGGVNGHPHVEKIKEGFESLVLHRHHHEKHESFSGSEDEYAVKPPVSGDIVNIVPVVDGIVNGHTEKLIMEEKLSSTAEIPRIFEDKAETKTMEVYGDKEFQNWGQIVRNTPRWTFIPKSILGLQNLVKWAKRNDFRVRCGGYRHSWSSTFSQDKQILVSLLNLEEVTKIPDAMSIEPEFVDPNNELKSIELKAPPGVFASSSEKALVRVGVSVTNEQFRRWAVQNDKWTLPVDVILVEVTVGGVNGPICHGAGRNHKTVNDYVRAVEYVDANGEHRTISDPEHLKAAAGHFGLMGVVTHITFELDKMSYAVLKPIKPDVCLAIPPPQLDLKRIPIALRKSYTKIQYEKALADFEDRANNHYYSEWFWFPRSQQTWVNTWNPIDDKTHVVEYPSKFQTWIQWVEGWLGFVMTTSPIFQEFPGRWQAEILATFGMVALPPFEFDSKNFEQNIPETIVTALPNALHFRRGIQNMRVRDLEFQIPIPGKKEDPSKPDYSIVQRAWWDIINLTYQNDATPMRLTMELRIMGDSNLIMAPQNGNRHGTASIEVLSIPDAVTDDEWGLFLQQVADIWLSYRDENDKPLNVRPHWAKEWEHINMRGKPAMQYLKEDAYKDAIPKFKATLADIGRHQGWDLTDLQKRFSNELWDYMIYS